MKSQKPILSVIINYLIDLSKLTYGSGFLASVLSKQPIYGIMSFGLLSLLLAVALYLKKGMYGDR